MELISFEEIVLPFTIEQVIKLILVGFIMAFLRILLQLLMSFKFVRLVLALLIKKKMLIPIIVFVIKA